MTNREAMKVMMEEERNYNTTIDYVGTSQCPMLEMLILNRKAKENPAIWDEEFTPILPIELEEDLF